MRVCVPSAGGGGLDDLVGEHFGRSPTYTIYDTETRALITQTVEFLGRRQLPQSSATALCFRIQAGFAEHPATVYTDQAGNLLRFEAGGMVLRSSTAAAIEQRFAEQRREVRRRLQQHGSPLAP